MSDFLEQDGIGEPVIMDDQIMIPIRDVVYTAKLQLNVRDLITILSLSSGGETSSADLVEFINSIESKFTPEGIITNLMNFESANWVMEQFLSAINDRQNKTEDQ